ncbi:MAG: hypothetical protein QXS79_06285 [Candidatus Bathyarchaeia archaeon]
MRLSMILNLYALKTKVFFGALRASKASIALLLVYVFVFLPSMIGISLTVTDAIRQGGVNAELYIDILAAVVSALMAFSILLSLRGVTAFEYEQNIIFTSPLRPGEFLIANFLTNLTYLIIFASPLSVLYVLIILSLSLSLAQAAIIFLSSVLLAISIIFLKMFFSMVKAFYGKMWVSALMLITAFILMFPTVGIFMQSLPRYNMLPYPSSLFARILINTILHGSFYLPDLLGFALFFIISLTLFTFASRRNFFPFTTQIPLISPFDVSARTQAFKMESNIRFFSRVNIPLSLSLESKSLLAFLIKKEIIRIAREGSLFTIILIYAILSVVFAAVGFPFASGSSPLLFILSIYSAIIPVMLTGNWRILESRNLWLPLSSGADVRSIIKATLYSFITVSLGIPTAIILPMSVFYGVNPIPALAILIPTSLIGCSVNLYVAVKFLRKRRKGAPSFLVGWLSMSLLFLLLAPIYVLAALSPPNLNVISNIVAPSGALIYSLIAMKVFLKLTENNVQFIEV